MWAFLYSSYGQNLLLKVASQTIQPHLTLTALKNLKIPNFSSEFQKRLSKIYTDSLVLREKSQEKYLSAEKILSEYLGLENFKPSTSNIAIVNSSEYLKTGRLDAEFYKPKYYEIEQKIFNYDSDAKKISDIAVYIFTGEYSEEYFQKNSAPNLKNYIRGTDISNGQIISDDEHCVISKNFSKFVKTGDILTGRVGTIGNFGVVDENLNGAVCSDNIICFRLPKKYNPNVYALYFNNEKIKSLCERLSRGSVQQRLNQETLYDLIVPKISVEVQEKISELVEESFLLRGESKKLLDGAKKLVEREIESS